MWKYVFSVGTLVIIIMTLNILLNYKVVSSWTCTDKSYEHLYNLSYIQKRRYCFLLDHCTLPSDCQCLSQIDNKDC